MHRHRFKRAPSLQTMAKYYCTAIGYNLFFCVRYAKRRCPPSVHLRIQRSSCRNSQNCGRRHLGTEITRYGEVDLHVSSLTSLIALVKTIRIRGLAVLNTWNFLSWMLEGGAIECWRLFVPPRPILHIILAVIYIPYQSRHDVVDAPEFYYMQTSVWWRKKRPLVAPIGCFGEAKIVGK